MKTELSSFARSLIRQGCCNRVRLYGTMAGVAVCCDDWLSDEQVVAGPDSVSRGVLDTIERIEVIERYEMTEDE